MHNDLTRAVDLEGGVLLILLDLSAAFDTINHIKLMYLLEKCFGLTGIVLKWIDSYLKDRYQSVKVGTAISEVIAIIFGVPQGSVLGPILFIQGRRTLLHSGTARLSLTSIN